MSEILQTVDRFLSHYFPGSRIDEGYYFVSIREGVEACIRHEQRQCLVDRICERPSLLVTVGVDPRPFVHATRVEQRVVDYNPDWDVHVSRPQWLAELPPQHVDVGALLSAGTEPGALVLIDPEGCVILDLYLRTVHAPSRALMESFLTGLEDAVDMMQDSDADQSSR